MSLSNISLVLNLLKDKSNLTIEEIIKITSINKETINRILLKLLSDKIIICDNNNYSLSPDFIKVKQLDNNNTYFNVKIIHEHKQIIEYLFNRINFYWIKYNKIKPTKTHMHKLIVEINNKLNLNLPLVWYKYGQIVPLVYDSSNEYNNINSNLDKQIPDDKIISIIKSNLNTTTRQIKEKQYTANNSNLNQAYLIKYKMDTEILNNNFNFVKDNFNILSHNLPYCKESNETLNEFNDFVKRYSSLELKNQKKSENKDLFIKLFSVFWDIISKYNFLHDIKEYYTKNNIDTKELDIIFNNETNKNKEEFNYLLEEFYSRHLSYFLNN
ncbi:MAG: hypothetical protein V1824_03815 [archaeon]